MPEFKKGNDWSNKFLSKSPWKKETRWEGPKDSQKPKARMLEKAKLKPKMVEAEKMKEPKLYSKMKEPKLYSKMKPSHLKATIAKDPSIDEELGLDKMKTTKATKKKDWEPAFEGADHSQEELDKMTKEEKEDYYN